MVFFQPLFLCFLKLTRSSFPGLRVPPLPLSLLLCSPACPGALCRGRPLRPALPRSYPSWKCCGSPSLPPLDARGCRSAAGELLFVGLEAGERTIKGGAPGSAPSGSDRTGCGGTSGPDPGAEPRASAPRRPAPPRLLAAVPGPGNCLPHCTCRRPLRPAAAMSEVSSCGLGLRSRERGGGCGS